jgi:aryl-alcohol dehydrogenase
MRTQAAIVRAAGAPFEIEEIELPELGSKDVLVRIAGVGICHTDLSSQAGKLGAPFPSIFGHEGSGVVEAVGSEVRKIAPGDHVVLGPASDGTCPCCQSGSPMYCEHGAELNFQTDPNGSTAALLKGGRAHLRYFGQSSFGHHALASERNAVKVRKDVPLALLGPLGCGIQTGAGTVMNGLRPQAGASLVVLGAGSVGLAAVLGAAVCGCALIIVVDRLESRLDFARTIGATHAINTSTAGDLTAAIGAILPRGADYIVDCAGVPQLIAESMRALGRLGTLGLVALPPAIDRKLELPWFSLLNAGQKAQGFAEGNSVPDIFIPQMIDLFRAGRFPFDKLIRTYPFAAINEAVADQLSGRAIKAVLVTDSAGVGSSQDNK